MRWLRETVWRQRCFKNGSAWSHRRVSIQTNSRHCDYFIMATLLINQFDLNHSRIDAQRPANKRRKRKGSNSGGGANSAPPVPSKKRSPGPNFSLASQVVVFFRSLPEKLTEHRTTFTNGIIHPTINSKIFVSKKRNVLFECRDKWYMPKWEL